MAANSNNKRKIMNKKISYLFQIGLTCVALSLTACGTTGTVAEPAVLQTAGPAPATLSATASAIEAALPLIRTGASVATGAVLDFAVKQSSTRTRLANEMYAAANAVYSLSGGTFPAPAQFESSILAFGGSQSDASYAQFSTAIAALYAAYYPKLVTGDTKTATDLLNAIAGGIEDATQAYVTTPTGVDMGKTEEAGPNSQIFQINEIFEEEGGNEIARTRALPSSCGVQQTWEQGGGEISTVSF